jgi:hypothetical protein
MSMANNRPQRLPQPSAGNGVKLVLAWGFVGIPLVWGVIQTLVNAIKAFQ